MTNAPPKTSRFARFINLRTALRGAAVTAFVLQLGCGQAMADRRGDQPLMALGAAPSRDRAPYDVQIIREGGDSLQTYRQNGRYYVMGDAGSRYTIRVTNPTRHRVEAVVSVDGIDAIDGETGDLAKRGYIIDAGGSVDIEGFRTSVSDVATFRFSSVAQSYAGKQGKARNVGVIAVALFEEYHRPPPPPPPRPVHSIPAKPASASTPDYDGNYESRSAQASAEKCGPRDDSAYGGDAPTTPSASAAPSPAAPSAKSSQGYGGGGRASDHASEETAQRDMRRPGLGTEFGERRDSAINYTTFTRASARPSAIAELRYNDRAGLVALGIPLDTYPDYSELDLRETADPFPASHFAKPPRN